MNWTVWAPVLGVLVTAISGLVGLVFQARKNHRIALKQIELNKEQIRETRKQSSAALRQAEAALEASRASIRTAEATAEAAIQDAFTRAYEAASSNWSHSQEGLQKWCEAQTAELARLSERQSKTEMALEAEKIRASKYEHLYALAIVYLHRLFGWVAEHVPGESPPPPPPELRPDLELEL